MMKKLLAMWLTVLLCLAGMPALAEVGGANEPVPLGSEYRYTDDDEDRGFTFDTKLLCVARGTAAKKLLNRWNSTNTSGIGSGKEWMLVKLGLNAVEAKEESITLKSRYFKFVSKDGVEYTRCMILGNPAEVKPFYEGAAEEAWVGCIIDKNDEPRLVYSPKKDVHVWFATEGRVAEELTLTETLKRGSEGKNVLRVEERLLELGDFEYEPDETYDYHTITAVKKFQHANGLKADGAVDEATAKALFSGE